MNTTNTNYEYIMISPTNDDVTAGDIMYVGNVAGPEQIYNMIKDNNYEAFKKNQDLYEIMKDFHSGFVKLITKSGQSEPSLDNLFFWQVRHFGNNIYICDDDLVIIVCPKKYVDEIIETYKKYGDSVFGSTLGKLSGFIDLYFNGVERVDIA